MFIGIAACAFHFGACHASSDANKVDAAAPSGRPAFFPSTSASILAPDPVPIPTDPCLGIDRDDPQFGYHAELEAGLQILDSGNAADAIKVFSELLSESPGDPAAVAGMTRAWQALSRASGVDSTGADPETGDPLRALGVVDDKPGSAAPDITKVCAANRSIAARVAGTRATTSACRRDAKSDLDLAKRLDPKFDPADCSALVDTIPVDADFVGTWNETSKHFQEDAAADAGTLRSAADFCTAQGGSSDQLPGCEAVAGDVAILSGDDANVQRLFLPAESGRVLVFASDLFLSIWFCQGIRVNFTKRGGLVWIHAVVWNEGRVFDSQNWHCEDPREVASIDLVYDLAKSQRVLRIVGREERDCEPERKISVKPTSSGFAYHVSVGGSARACEGQISKPP